MPDIENIEEESREDGKPESPGEADDELQFVNRETLARPMRESNVNEETKINKSEINKSEIAMEVHHHPHVEKKNFKEYFLEFLMIFLAVTLGFFAENVRENIGDAGKEKEYIRSLYDDMHQDSINICASLAFSRRQIQKIDSLVYIINQHSPDSNQINAAYFCARVATRYFYFEETDRTIKQLNNSGNFRLIKNEALADSIVDYEKNIASIRDNHPTDVQERESLYPFIASIFDANVFQTMVDSTNHIQRISGLHTLDIGDKKLNNRFIYYLHQVKSTTISEKVSLLRILQQTSGIRNIIRENYNIQN
jgi:hypothetical protein